MSIQIRRVIYAVIAVVLGTLAATTVGYSLIAAGQYGPFLVLLWAGGIASALGVAFYACAASRHASQEASTETRCRKCGHILRGISEPRCPECGERI